MNRSRISESVIGTLNTIKDTIAGGYQNGDDKKDKIGESVIIGKVINNNVDNGKSGKNESKYMSKNDNKYMSVSMIHINTDNCNEIKSNT